MWKRKKLLFAHRKSHIKQHKLIVDSLEKKFIKNSILISRPSGVSNKTSNNPIFWLQAVPHIKSYVKKWNEKFFFLSRSTAIIFICRQSYSIYGTQYWRKIGKRDGILDSIFLPLFKLQTVQINLNFLSFTLFMFW